MFYLFSSLHSENKTLQLQAQVASSCSTGRSVLRTGDVRALSDQRVPFKLRKLRPRGAMLTARWELKWAQNSHLSVFRLAIH